MVEINGTVQIENDAPGSELRDIAVVDTAVAAVSSLAMNTLVSRVWVHSSVRGLQSGVINGPASIRVEDSLFDTNEYLALLVLGGDAVVTDTVVRDTQPQNGIRGRGIVVQAYIPTPDSVIDGSLLLQRSLVERNHYAGIAVLAATATIEDTLVRDTFPRPLDQQLGRGVEVDDDLDMLRRSTLMLTRSKLERNHNISLLVMASDATIESLLIRDTIPTAATGDGGIGQAVASVPGNGA